MALKSGGKTKRFEYQERSADQVRARATASGSREGFLADGIKTFSPKAGAHSVRILPPTWEGATHYGLDLFAHYNIGVDSGAYLCPQKMQQEECAICSERNRATKEGDEELEDALKPRQRVACWVIDRDNERDGPLLWMMPWTLDREIVQQSIDKKSGEVYNLDHPEDGYDVSFDRTGDGKNTKYTGVQLERKSSPLSDDPELMEEWLAFVKENPIPDQLIYQDSDRLESIVGDGLTVNKRRERDNDKGKGKRGKEEEDEPKKGKPDRARLKPREEEEEVPKKSKAKKIDVEDLDWDAVHEMDAKQLITLSEQEEIDIEDCDEESEAADKICEALEIKKPKSKKPAEEEAPRSRLAGLKAKLGKGKKDEEDD